MVNKRWVILLVVLLILCTGLSIFLGIKSKQKVVAKYEEEQSKLLATINAYGSEVTVYTVKSSVQAGEEITRDNVVAMTQYSSSVTDQMVRSLDDILGKEFKIALSNGTPITYNMVMEESIQADTREHDIILDSWPVGLIAGDYIDLKITMPYGDDYIVVPHKRVYQVNENTLKLYMTTDEWAAYVGAFVDYSLNQAYGATIYADKYVEPGIQVAAVSYYAVPTNIAALLQKNPNVVDKEAVGATNEWRSSIEELLTIFRDTEDTVDTDGATLADKRAEYNQAVKTDMNTARENAEEAEGDNTDSDEEFTWTDANASAVGAADNLDAAISEGESNLESAGE